MQTVVLRRTNDAGFKDPYRLGPHWIGVEICGAPIPLVECPDCGTRGPLIHHQVDRRGRVTQPVTCHACGWYGIIQLENWWLDA